MSILVLVSLLLSIALPVAYLVNDIVPDAYMDEIFHIPQAQRYCQGDFHAWDPKITTLPGLYIVSLAYKFMVSLWIPGELCCSVKVLRSINIFLSLVCVLLFRSILMHIRPQETVTALLLKSLLLALFPLHWFFAFLYYTDVGSTAAVLAMYLACLKRSYWLSAMLSVFAILFRQTNAVWTVFALCVGVLQFLQDGIPSPKVKALDDSGVLSEAQPGSLRRRKREQGTAAAIDSVRPTEQCSNVKVLMRSAWKRKFLAMKQLSPFVVVILAFLAFVAYNGSIVVGAKDEHKVSPHFAQPLYFSLFTAAVLAPLHFSLHSCSSLRQDFRNAPTLACLVTAAGSCVSLLSIHFFSLAHPYLLADNRHYTFYIWKDIIQAHWSVKYLLTPFYMFSWWSIAQSLMQNLPEAEVRSPVLRKLWLTSFCGAVIAVLVPAPLVEFRYFTVPFYLVALHSFAELDVSSWKFWFLAVEFLVVNTCTMRLFLWKPFEWSHEPGTQRFIW